MATVSQTLCPCELSTNTATALLYLVVRVEFDEESYGVTEGSDSVSVCVRREGEAEESFSINVATSDNNLVQAEGTYFGKRDFIVLVFSSVSAGSDYQPVATSLTFAPGDERQCFQVSVLVDQLDEGKEDFRAELSTTSDISVTNASATISILDSHGKHYYYLI